MTNLEQIKTIYYEYSDKYKETIGQQKVYDLWTECIRKMKEILKFEDYNSPEYIETRNYILITYQQRELWIPKIYYSQELALDAALRHSKILKDIFQLDEPAPAVKTCYYIEY